jgi:hypothetical protein
MNSSAWFSDDRKYRYTLSRIWDIQKPYLLFCMLNPSKADGVDNDPTVARCKRRAELLGFGGLIVVNVFAFISTDPKGLKKTEDPVGKLNMFVIERLAKDAGLVICGWGKHGSLYGQGEKVLSAIRKVGAKPHALKINKDGSPAHPLYIGYDVKPVKMPCA